MSRQRGTLILHLLRLIPGLTLGPLLAFPAHAADLIVEPPEGPIVSSQRVVGMGGAFVGLAEGADAHLINPASFAVRSPFFAHDWFDWDFTLAGTTVLSGKSDLDLSRDGRRLASSDVGQAGINFKFGRFGIGGHVRYQNMVFRYRNQANEPVEVTYGGTFGGIGTAYAWKNGEWTAGALWSAGSTQISSTAASNLIKMASGLFPYQLGVVHMPRGEPWRLGLTLQLPVPQFQRDQNDKVKVVVSALGDLPAPTRIEQPWSVSLGGAWQWGKRPLNPRPAFGQAPLPGGSIPAKRLARQYILATADLVVIAPADDPSVGTPGYLTGGREAVGRSSSFSARAGVESEVWENRLAVRTGVYYEPSRYERASGRPHWTGGGDLRLSLILDWRVSFVFDLARDWATASVGLGLWH